MGKKKDFLDINIKDVQPLIDEHNASVDESEQKDYKYLKFPKDAEGNCFTFLKKKSFSDYKEDNEVKIVGRIRKRQRKYKGYQDINKYCKKKYDNQLECINEKQNDDIIGCATVYDGDDNVHKYDIKEAEGKHVCGYAWIGDDKWLEVTRFNLLILLIPLLCALLVGVLFASCPNDKPPVDIPIKTGEEVTEPTTEDIPESPLAYFPVFSEVTQLDKDNKTIKLYNHAKNNGVWYISYSIYVYNEDKSELVLKLDSAEDFENDTINDYDGTFIAPDEINEDGMAVSKPVNYNLYDLLDAGTYQLEVVGVEYTYDLINEALKAKTLKAQEQLIEEAKQDIPAKLVTTLVVKK